MRAIRIEIIGNQSFVKYKRGAISSRHIVGDASFIGGPLKTAFETVRCKVRILRSIARGKDRLAQKEPRSVLRMLEEKRANAHKVCLEEKRPLSDLKHVAVEIEFLSTSDRKSIAMDMAKAGLGPFVELKRDGSVQSDNDVYCNGDCREDCECYHCHEYHYCDNEGECNRTSRDIGVVISDRSAWYYNEDCLECDDTEYLDDCLCAGNDDNGQPLGCLGTHAVCHGHCPGHYCQGSDDHPDYECSCACDCGGKEEGHEIAICAKSIQIADVVTRVCAVLAEHEAKVNSTCGLHVHLDARNYNETRMFRNLVNSQRLLYSMVPRSRYTNQYCKPNNSNNLGDYDGCRYWGINPESYDKHGTIEVRLHCGSVNATKIVNWVKLLQKIAYSKKTIKPVNTIADLTKAVKLSKKLEAYILERVMKFEPEHKSYSVANGAITDASVIQPAEERTFVDMLAAINSGVIRSVRVA